MRIQVLAVAAVLFLASLAAVWSLGRPGADVQSAAPERVASAPAAPTAQPGAVFGGGAASDPLAPSGARPGRAADGGAEGRAAADAAEAPAPGAAAVPAPRAPDDADEAESWLVSREAGELLAESSFEDDVQAAAEEAYALLHSADPDQRTEGIQDLAFHDPERARAEIERMLANEGDPDVRVAAYEELLSLIEEDGERIDLMVRGLGDRADAVREHIAYLVSSEDTDTYPQLVSAMHRALNAERNPDVYDQVESSLELMDSSFVPRYLQELEEPLEDFEFVELGTDPGNG